MSPRRREVRLLRSAEDDLNDIVSYIALDDVTAAEALVLKIENKLSRLADHPHLGRIPSEEELKALGYRYLIIDNYLAFYTITDRSILIHRILHGARDYIGLL